MELLHFFFFSDAEVSFQKKKKKKKFWATSNVVTRQYITYLELPAEGTKHRVSLQTITMFDLPPPPPPPPTTKTSPQISPSLTLLALKIRTTAAVLKLSLSDLQ